MHVRISTKDIMEQPEGYNFTEQTMLCHLCDYPFELKIEDDVIWMKYICPRCSAIWKEMIKSRNKDIEITETC